MKKLLHLFILLGSLSNLNAQVVFCPPGATWNYLFSEMYPKMGSVNEQITYTGYSIENGDTVKNLAHNKFYLQVNFSPVTFTSIKQKGDTVFMRNARTNNQWQILYNFAATAGQSWTNNFIPGNIGYTTQVTSAGTTFIGSKLVKQLSVSYSNSYSSGHTGLITEYYGSNGFLFNYISQEATDGDYFMERLCYKDNVTGTQQFSTHGCNYSNLTGIKVYRNEQGINVFPNPSHGKLKITNELNPGQTINISLTNMLGQNLLSFKSNLETQDFDITHLPTGIYYLAIETENAQQIFKLLKE